MKKASTSTATVIKEIAPLYGLTEMEAGILLKWKEGEGVDDESLKGKIADKLYEKGFLSFEGLLPVGSWYGYQYLRTERGKRFVSAVETRKETRILFNMGCDLFPETANI